MTEVINKIQNKHTFSMQKRTNVSLNVQHFVEKYFPAITEYS